ncbi:MAG: glycosyltransferase family 2 protein [Acetobacteraceae bacterium]
MSDIAQRVTVGIPVYNNGTTLRRAVESVMAQSCGACAVLISDNASTDETGTIGSFMAASYPTVSYVRQKINLDHYGNFRFTVNSARTPYFMWLAGDDYLEPDYIARTGAVLDAQPDVVTCVSNVLFTRADGSSRIAPGTYPLMHSPTTNLAVYLSDPTDNSRLFGLHRTEVIQAAFPRSDFLIGYDWAAMAATLMRGKHARVPEVLMIRDETPSDAYCRMIRRYYRFPPSRLLPMARMSADLLWRVRVPREGRVIRALVALNLMMHIQYMQVYHPWYTKVGASLERNLLWRLRTLTKQD